MTKEQYIKEYKDCIITLRLKRSELKTNRVLLDKWQKKIEMLKAEYTKFSKPDQKWLEGEHRKFCNGIANSIPQ